MYADYTEGYPRMWQISQNSLPLLCDSDAPLTRGTLHGSRQPHGHTRQRRPRNIRDPATYAIIGVALAVHRELGCGFLEGVHRAALRIEFDRRGIPFEGEVPLPIRYAGQYLPLGYRADFVCYTSVLVEVKSLVRAEPLAGGEWHGPAVIPT